MVRDNKINFVYHSLPDNRYPYALYEGLRKSLERTGHLHYAYDIRSKELIDFDRLKERPIFFIRGYLPCYAPIVAALHGRQPLISWETETKFNNDGSKNIFYDKMRDTAPMFDIVFVDKGEVGDYFGRPTKVAECFVPIAEYDAVLRPSMMDAGFVGNMTSRRRRAFVTGTAEYVTHINSKEMPTSYEHLQEYIRTMKTFKILVSPAANTAKSTFCLRTFEYMACKRLCLAQHEPHMEKMFENMKEIVYWETFEQLREQVEYYLSHPDEAQLIGDAGYEAVKARCDEDVVVDKMVRLIYDSI